MCFCSAKTKDKPAKKDKNERKEKKGIIRRIRIESNLAKKRERGRYNSKVRGKTEGEIGKVSTEKGDTLRLPHRFTRQWRVIRGTACLLDPVYLLHKIPNTVQYYPGR